MGLLDKIKKGNFEMDELGRIIFYVIVLIVIIAIIVVAIQGEFGTQAGKIKDAFNIFK